jgi:hypothetical protein
LSEQTVFQKQLYFIAKKIYIVLQFYVEILNSLLLSLIFQVFSTAHAERVIVLLCLRTALPVDDTYKCSYLVLSFIPLMMAQKWPKHVEDYNSI